jgi:acyl-CoA synthetase (AMP-forming)/AMP-acid ligase II
VQAWVGGVGDRHRVRPRGERDIARWLSLTMGPSEPVPPGNGEPTATHGGQVIRIVGTDDVAVPQGETGEVLIKAECDARLPESAQGTAKTIVDGRLHTGDIGHLDEDGYLVLADSAKDMVIRGGGNIYPMEIATVVLQGSGRHHDSRRLAQERGRKDRRPLAT